MENRLLTDEEAELLAKRAQRIAKKEILGDSQSNFSEIRGDLVPPMMVQVAILAAAIFARLRP